VVAVGLLSRLIKRLRPRRDKVVSPSSEDLEKAAGIIGSMESDGELARLEKRLEELRRRLKDIEDRAGSCG
jgi:polyhydroxyalkanoate synthesis regulator phasin